MLWKLKLIQSSFFCIRLQKETSNLEKSVETQVKKQTSIENRMKMCGGQTVNLRYGLFHMVDVLRHVQSADFMKPLEYPTVDLKLPLLRSNAPVTPSVVNADSKFDLILLLLHVATKNFFKFQSFSTTWKISRSP